MEIERPKIGIGVLIKKDNQILLGLRKSKHGNGYWSPPGGHLEFSESFVECAARETLEEAGIKIKDTVVAALTNDLHDSEGKHYVTITLVANYEEGKVTLMEPHKWVEWAWFDWDKLPEPLFMPIKKLVDSGLDPFNQTDIISV